MKLAKDCNGKCLVALLKDFNFQPGLTRKLDAACASNRQFDQQIINEIVLWKVNRYAPLSQATMSALNKLASLTPGQHKQGEFALTHLLCEPGIDLPMASTILRFRNFQVFQIIDRHAYRALYGKNYPLHPTSGCKTKTDVYFKYLDDLIELARSQEVKFSVLDRVLYIFDKKYNGKL